MIDPTVRPLALTMGDPAGIGGECTLKAWQARRDGYPFVALDDPSWLNVLAQRLHLHVPIVPVADADEAMRVFPTALPVIAMPLANQPHPGVPDPANAKAIVGSITRAAAMALNGQAGAMVTNPINKAALYATGFAYPGHTEFLAALTGVPGQEVMMLASPLLRVVPVTVHVSLRDAIAMLTSDLIVSVARTAHAALRRDFGIGQPRLALAGLNPHAGEQGALGKEESVLVAPAIERLRAEGIDVTGPWPPDTMFTRIARTRYDVAICLYHDQALIPLKTLDMDHGVNVTLGLPIVRTSADHGTAYDIAGQGRADPTSLLAALDLAADLVRHRTFLGSAASGG